MPDEAPDQHEDDAAAEAAADLATPPDALMIRVQYGPDGGVNLVLAPLGSVRAAEVPTILEIALKEARSALGLGG